MERYYFDWAASSPISTEALQVYTETALQHVANPSSVHSPGRAAGAALSGIRSRFATLMGVPAQQLFFTSGGTEANALICNSFLMKKRPIHLVISGIEHPSIFEYIQRFKQLGHSVTILPAPGGRITPESVASALRPETALVLIMSVNNVLGTIQPLEQISAVIRAYEQRHRCRIHLHADAVQAFGKIDRSHYLPHADSISVSAHKLQGPRGTGLLYSRKPFLTPSPGGGQESGMRPGTENLPAIAAFYQCSLRCHSNLEADLAHAQSMKDHLIMELKSRPAIKVLTPPQEHASPYILGLSIPRIPSEVFMRVLDDRGVSISTGSACSSKNRKKAQRIFLQSGFDQRLCDGALRISFGPSVTADDIAMLSRSVIEESDRLLKEMG